MFAFPNQFQFVNSDADGEPLGNQYQTGGTPITSEVSKVPGHCLAIVRYKNPTAVCGQRKHFGIGHPVTNYALGALKVDLRIPGSETPDDAWVQIGVC